MSTILIHPFPATGHFNASYGLAECLKSKGHRIVYFGTHEFRESILKNGWEYYVVESSIIPYYLFESRKYGSLVAWFNNLTEQISGKREMQQLEIQERNDYIIKKINPDLILLDAFYIGEAVYYYKHKIKIISYQSMVATNADSFAPPYRYSFVPSGLILSTLYVSFLWRKHILWKSFKNRFYKVWHCKQGYIELLKKTSKQTGFPFNSELDINHFVSYGFSFKSIPELILSPPEFDFRKEIRPNHLHVGPILHHQRDSYHADLRFSKVLNDILLLKANSNNKVVFIYCSLGTNTYAELKLVHKFFQKIRNICCTNKKIVMLISVGKDYDIKLLGDIPENLFVFKSVPQLEVLKQCDMMITHGGMNTVTECVLNEVPMLVYSLVKVWDQPGNAARVVYHGLGLKGKITRDSYKQMQLKMNYILKNYQLFKDNLHQMKYRFNLDYKKEYAVNIIETHLNTKTYGHQIHKEDINTPARTT